MSFLVIELTDDFNSDSICRFCGRWESGYSVEYFLSTNGAAFLEVTCEDCAGICLTPSPSCKTLKEDPSV